MLWCINIIVLPLNNVKLLLQMVFFDFKNSLKGSKNKMATHITMVKSEKNIFEVRIIVFLTRCSSIIRTY